MKKRLGANTRLFPMPCTLVVGGTMDEADVLTAAWINMISSTPPTIVLGLRESRHTLELIRTTNTFTVNIPTASQVAAVDYCGITTGRSTDKFTSAGFTAAPSAVVPTPIIAECPYNIECEIAQEATVGAYTVLFGTVVESHADESVLLSDGDMVDMNALDPLSYIPGVREYWRLGGKVADAYEVGKSIG